MESIGQVKQQLVAQSEDRAIADFEQRGRNRVRVIRAGHIAGMIDRAVELALRQNNLLPRNEAIQLVEATRAEFVGTVEAQQAEIESLRDKLSAARTRLAQFEALFGGSAALPPEPTPQSPPAPSNAAHDEMLLGAVDKLTDAMNQRLDQMSRKLGISTAVEAGKVDFGHLFTDHGEAPVESNIQDLQVKQKSSGGIAANLERLKKLKGGD